MFARELGSPESWGLVCGPPLTVTLTRTRLDLVAESGLSVLRDSWGAGWGVVISFEPYEAQSLKKS